MDKKTPRPDRKPHLRLTGYDYSKTNYYYVTICAQNRIDWFGRIIDGKMVLNDTGKIVDEKWQWLMHQYPYIIPDEYVVMPDHFHGILVIDNPNDYNGMQFKDDGEIKRDRSRPVPTYGNGIENGGEMQPDRSRPVPTKNKQPGKIKPLSSLIGAFKSRSSAAIHKSGLPDFTWQRSFYDRIIRSDDELDHVRGYIRNNPAQKQDKGKSFICL